MGIETTAGNGRAVNGAVPAQSKGICKFCDRPIEKGELVRQAKRFANGRVRWAHADCVAGSVPGDTAQGNGSMPEEAREFLEAVKRGTEQLHELQARVKELEANRPQVVEIRKPGGKAVKIDGAVHPVFEQVVELATARKHIFLPGPSGSGKSHLARQVAEALELRFGAISCSAGMSESQLLGRMVPHGAQGQFEFLGTEFLDCYENGGVFLFDEIDAADSNVLLVINSALANGHLSVPSRHDKPVAKRHPNFVCIAAANTWGRGADRQYVGRNELDESTLDRFRIGTVPMDYSEELERQLCPDTVLYDRLKTYRQRAQENRLERIVSTRFIAEAHEMRTRWGWTHKQIDEKLFQSWRPDEVRKVKGA